MKRTSLIQRQNRNASGAFFPHHEKRSWGIIEGARCPMWSYAADEKERSTVLQRILDDVLTSPVYAKHRRQLTIAATALAMGVATPESAKLVDAASFTAGCTAGVGDVSSLVSLINTANGNGQANSITLGANCTYDMTAVDNWWYGPNAFPAIKSVMTIEGNGATIKRNTTSQPTRLRFFYIGAAASNPNLPVGYKTPGEGNLTLRNLTLQDGRQQGGAGGGGGAGMGGAIFNQGTLQVENCTLVGNAAQGGIGSNNSGGGMGQDGSYSSGGGFGGAPGGTFDGGGVGTFGMGGSGLVSGGIGGGGGFRSADVGSAGNFGGGGGNGGAGGFGGGGGNGFLTSFYYYIVGWFNVPVSGGSGGFAGGSGCSSYNTGGGGGGLGGAVFNHAGSVGIINSTFTGNAASGGASADCTAGSGFGGAFFSLDGTVTITNSTLAGNTVSGNQKDGGAVYNYGAAMTLVNNIFYGTSGGTDYYQYSGATTSSAPNIIGTRTVSTGTFTGTPLTSNPILSALASNGGPTKTMAMSVTNPAVNAGTTIGAPTTDQRGYNRIGAPDLGSYEYGATAGTPQTITVTTAAPSSAAYNSQFTVAATASSGLAVTYSSGSTSVCTNSGATFTMNVPSGACLVQYDQAGNGSYQAAPQVTNSTAATKAGQSIGAITFSPTTLAVGGTTTASASASSGLGVTFSSDTPATCSVSGVSVSGIASGTCTIAADQTGNANYDAATPVTQNITVDPPSAGGVVATAPLASGRDSHTATLLQDGKVFVAGGWGGSSELISTELYDPVAGTWSAGPDLKGFRSYHTATRLNDGRVLITGGTSGAGYLRSAELYDPGAGTTTVTGDMSSPRIYHTATLLADGKVLVAGGTNGSVDLATAEMFDPATGIFTYTVGGLGTAREGHTATRLSDGSVLIAGGSNGGVSLNSLKIFNPASETFSDITIAAPPYYLQMTSLRAMHAAALLPDGKVLITGGSNGSADLSTAELIDVTAKTAAATTGSMAAARDSHTATELLNGKVLIAGGWSNTTALSGFELYDPASGTFGSSGTMSVERAYHTATRLNSGNVLLVGGYNTTSGDLNSAEIYLADASSPTTTTITAPGITYGANGSVTVTVSSAASAPAGNVNLSVDGGAPLTQALSAATATSSTATFTLTKPTAVSHALNASYVGQGGLSSSSASGTLAVSQRSLTVTMTASNKEYDGTTSAAVTYSDNRVAGDVLATNGAAIFADKNVGTGKTVSSSAVTLSGADAGNYVVAGIPASTTANITARPITITADAKTKVAGAGDPALTWQVTSGSLASGDSLTGSLTRVAGESVGTYAIQQGTVSAGSNYQITYVGANLTITIGTQSLLDIANWDITNGIAAMSGSLLTVGANRTPYGDTIRSKQSYSQPLLFTWKGWFPLSTNSAHHTGIGQAPFYSPGGSPSANVYMFETAWNKPNDLFLIYPGVPTTWPSVPGITIDNGFIYGDFSIDWSNDKVTWYFNGSQVRQETFASTTPVYLYFVAYDHQFQIESVSVTTNTIIKTPATVTLGSLAQTYDGTPKTATSTTNPSGLTVHYTYNGSSVAPTAAGSYTVVGTISDATYEGSATGTLVISPRTLTVTASGINKIYDGNTTATATLNDNRIAGDILALSYTSATFADKNVGTGKPVSVSGISKSGTGSGNYVLAATTTATSANITAKGLTVSGMTANNKVYDGNTTATLTGGSLVGVVSGDVVTFSGQTGTFSSKTVGTGKVVTVTGITLAGADAGNYTVTNPTGLTASITAKGLTVSGMTANNKIYDGNTTATLTGGSLTGVISGDVVSFSGQTGTFADKNVGTGKPVTVTGVVLSGADSGNYTVTNPTGLTANITVRTLTVTATGINKVYNGTTAATVTLSDNRIAGDVLTASYTTAVFNNKNVGTNKPVNVSGISISGTDAGNYTLAATTAATTASITAKPFTVTVTGINKVYDGTTVATVTYIDNRAAGDDITISGTAVFADKNVGTGKTVSVTGITVSGPDAANYTLGNTTASTTADITVRTLTVSATGINKVYDGNTTATVTLSDNRIAGDVLTTAYTSATFADKNVGTGKPVSVNGISKSGTDAGNYVLAATTAATSANITVRNLTVTATGINKVYDGNTTAAVTLNDNRVAGDVLTASYTTALFNNKNVGTNKPVNVSGISISGTDAGNYTLAATTASTIASITAKAFIVSFTGINKVYDGTSIATFSYTDNRSVGDDITIIGTAVFSDKNVGAGKTVSISGITITGPDAGNYSLGSTTATTTANITARTLTVTATGINKVYDGNITATVTLSDNRVAGDVLATAYTSATFDTKNVGTGKPVSVTGISKSGTDAGNYVLAATIAATTANITARTLTVTATGINKVYDGTTTATVSFSDNRVAGDSITIGGVALFSGKNVGVGKLVSISGLGITGIDAGNYTLASTTASTTATISKKPLTITADDKYRYAGNANPMFTYVPSGFAAGDSPAVLSGSPSLTTTATASSPAGSYPIIAAVGTLSATNYSFVFVDGTLMVYQQYALTINIIGGGTINNFNADSPAFTPCSSGTCSAMYDVGSVFTLSASPAVSFVGWSGGGCSAGDCSVSLTDNVTVTATFNPLVKLQGSPTGFQSLQGAYDSAVSNSLTDAVLLSRDKQIDGSLNLHSAVNVVIRGGFTDTGFTADNDYTTLNGALTVSKGTLVVRKLLIK